MTRIDEIRQRLAVITPGTWLDAGIEDEYDSRMIAGSNDEHDVLCNVHTPLWDNPKQRDNNAAFIAAAPEDVRYLLAKLDAIESLVKDYKIKRGAASLIPHLEKREDVLDKYLAQLMYKVEQIIKDANEHNASDAAGEAR